MSRVSKLKLGSQLENDDVLSRERYFSLFPFRRKRNKIVISTFFVLFLTGLMFIALGNALSNVIYNDFYDAALNGVALTNIDHLNSLNNASNVFYIIGGIILKNVPLVLAIAILPVFRVRITKKTAGATTFAYFFTILTTAILTPIINPNIVDGFGAGITDFNSTYDVVSSKFWGMNIVAGYTWFIAFIIPAIFGLILNSRSTLKDKISVYVEKENRTVVREDVPLWIGSVVKGMKNWIFFLPFLLPFITVYLYPLLSINVYELGGILASNQTSWWASFLNGFLSLLFLPIGLTTTLTAGFANGISTNIIAVSDIANITNETANMISTYSIGFVPTAATLNSVVFTAGQFKGINGANTVMMSLFSMFFMLSIIGNEYHLGRKYEFKIISKNKAFLAYFFTASIALILAGMPIPIIFIFVFLSPITLSVSSLLYGLVYTVPVALGAYVMNFTSIPIANTLAPNSSMIYFLGNSAFVQGEGSAIAGSFIIAIFSAILIGILIYQINRQIHKKRLNIKKRARLTYGDQSQVLIVTKVSGNVDGSWNRPVHTLATSIKNYNTDESKQKRLEKTLEIRARKEIAKANKEKTNLAKKQSDKQVNISADSPKVSTTTKSINNSEYDSKPNNLSEFNSQAQNQGKSNKWRGATALTSTFEAIKSFNPMHNSSPSTPDAFENKTTTKTPSSSATSPSVTKNTTAHNATPKDNFSTTSNNNRVVTQNRQSNSNNFETLAQKKTKFAKKAENTVDGTGLIKILEKTNKNFAKEARKNESRNETPKPKAAKPVKTTLNKRVDKKTTSKKVTPSKNVNVDIKSAQILKSLEKDNKFKRYAKEQNDTQKLTHWEIEQRKLATTRINNIVDLSKDPEKESKKKTKVNNSINYKNKPSLVEKRFKKVMDTSDIDNEINKNNDLIKKIKSLKLLVNTDIEKINSKIEDHSKSKTDQIDWEDRNNNDYKKFINQPNDEISHKFKEFLSKQNEGDDDFIDALDGTMKPKLKVVSEENELLASLANLEGSELKAVVNEVTSETNSIKPLPKKEVKRIEKKIGKKISDFTNDDKRKLVEFTMEIDSFDTPKPEPKEIQKAKINQEKPTKKVIEKVTEKVTEKVIDVSLDKQDAPILKPTETVKKEAKPVKKNKEEIKPIKDMTLNIQNSVGVESVVIDKPAVKKPTLPSDPLRQTFAMKVESWVTSEDEVVRKAEEKLAKERSEKNKLKEKYIKSLEMSIDRANKANSPKDKPTRKLDISSELDKVINVDVKEEEAPKLKKTKTKKTDKELKSEFIKSSTKSIVKGLGGRGNIKEIVSIDDGMWMTIKFKKQDKLVLEHLINNVSTASKVSDDSYRFATGDMTEDIYKNLIEMMPKLDGNDK